MAQREYFANNADSTLDGAINSSTTTVTVIDGTAFPAGGFRISIEDEILYVLTKSGNVMTVVRGAEGTTGASHADTTPVTHLLTAGSIEQLKLDALAMMGSGRKPTTANTYGDEFDDDNFTGWTAVNSGGSPVDVIVEKDHFCSMLIPTGGAAAQWNSYMKNCGSRSSGDEISASFRCTWPNSGFPQPCVWFADGATYGSGNQVGFGFSPHENTFVLRTATGFNAQAAFNGTSGGYDDSLSFHDMNVKLQWNGSSNYTWSYSLDGIQWMTQATTASASFTPTWCGFGFTSWGGSYTVIASLRYFRTNF